MSDLFKSWWALATFAVTMLFVCLNLSQAQDASTKAPQPAPQAAVPVKESFSAMMRMPTSASS